MSPVNAQSLFLYTSFGTFPYLFLVLVYFGRVCSCFIFRVLVWFGLGFLADLVLVFFCCCCCLLIWFGFKILLLALTKLIFMLHLFLVWLTGGTDPLRCFWNSHSIPQLICSSWQTPRGRSLNKFCHSEIQVFSYGLFSSWSFRSWNSVISWSVRPRLPLMLRFWNNSSLYVGPEEQHS